MGKSKILILFTFFVLLLSTQLNVFAIPDKTVKTSGNQFKISNSNDGYDIKKNSKDDITKMDKKIKQYQELAAFFGGLATISMVAIFMKHCIKLGVLGTEHWAIKRNSIMSLLWSGLAAALLGSMTTIFVITYKLFQ